MSVLIGSAVCLSVTPEMEYRPLNRRMSAPGLTSEAQMRYLVQWFGEFSELQREDFLPILASARGGKPELLAATLAGLTCEDKPVSLFQCRIKLFNEWFPCWAEEDQDRLIKSVTEIDAVFGAKLDDLLKNGLPSNGTGNDIEEHRLEAAPESKEPLTNGDHEEVEEQQSIAQENVPVEIAAAS